MLRIRTRLAGNANGVLLAVLLVAIAPLCGEETKTACSLLNAEIAAKAGAWDKPPTNAQQTDIRADLTGMAYVTTCGIPDSGLSGLSQVGFEKMTAKLVEAKQPDKQVGASGGTGGSTSLVSHGLAPALLGFALEAGGIERDISGSVVTLRANPVTLIQALAKKYGPGVTPPSDALLNALNRVSVAGTFDTSRTATSTGSDTVSPFLANYKQLTEFSARAAIWNGRDPYRRKNWIKFNKLAKTPEAALMAEATAQIAVALATDAAYLEQVQATMRGLGSANAEERNDALAAHVKVLRAAMQRVSATAGSAAKTFVESSVKARGAREALVQEIAGQAVINLEYVLVRPPAVAPTASSTAGTTGLNVNPDVSALRLVGTWKAGTSDVSWNAAATMFHTLRPGMHGNFRDFNTGASVSTPVGTIPNVGPVSFTAAGRYMHLHQKPVGIAVLFNSTKINQPGDIWWAQAKFTFPGPNNAIKIPLSFTYASRTELIAEKDVRVNVGFTFDLDAVLKK